MSDENLIKLWESLSKCFELWFRPKNISKEVYWVAIRSFWWNCMVSFLIDKKEKTGILMWFNDLFSKDSWLMDYIEWKPMNKDLMTKFYREFYENSDVYFRYVIMCDMTWEEKVQYFIDNAMPPNSQTIYFL